MPEATGRAAKSPARNSPTVSQASSATPLTVAETEAAGAGAVIFPVATLRAAV